MQTQPTENNEKTEKEMNDIRNFAAFSEELLTAALEGMKDQLSPEELDAMRQEGETMISDFKKEHNIA